MLSYTCAQKKVAEFLGTAFLLMSIVGSGIMADSLANGNIALALLANAVSIGAVLFVLITMLGPLSGAHFNPAVTLSFAIKKEIPITLALIYVTAQILGGVFGVLSIHIMYEQEIVQASDKVRMGYGQFFAEMIATFGLVFTILATLRFKPKAVPAAVGLYITSAIWFTSSTSFANPAVTISRMFSDSFTGIRPEDVAPFIIAQIIGALIAVALCAWLLAERESDAAEQSQSSDPVSTN